MPLPATKNKFPIVPHRFAKLQSITFDSALASQDLRKKPPVLIALAGNSAGHAKYRATAKKSKKTALKTKLKTALKTALMGLHDLHGLKKLS